MFTLFVRPNKHLHYSMHVDDHSRFYANFELLWDDVVFALAGGNCYFEPLPELNSKHDRQRATHAAKQT